MISQKTINEIFETAKVEDVVSEFVNLKKRGVNMIGLCPFHNEKTPSFTVSPSKNIYKCFGCGEAGNPVNFLMTHENFTYPEALRYLARKYNIEIEETQTSRESIEEKQLFESLYLINSFAHDWYQDQLFGTPKGQSVGLGYFKERGFLEETVKKFGLGYAPEDGDLFTNAAKKKGYNPELLQKAGLTTSYQRDFFRKRVLFTIHNLTGKVVGFGGRTLESNKKIPKYINTPESEVYNKSKILYGIFFSKKAIRQNDLCLMVEGYTDVISLHQSGIENVVASSGTSLTVDQIRLVKRFTPNLTILYDGDPAGIKAATRGLDLVLEQDMNVRIVLLPEGEDPDSYLRQVGATEFKEYIDTNAKDFIFFKTSLLLDEAQGDPIKKTELIKDIVSSISRIRDPIKRSVYIKECSKRLDVDERVLLTSTNKIIQNEIAKRQQKEESKFSSAEESWPTEEPHIGISESDAELQTSSAGKDDFQERDIVRLLVKFGNRKLHEQLSVSTFIAVSMEEIFEEFDNEFYKEIVMECFQKVVSKEEISQEYFLNHPNERVRKLAIDLITTPYEYSQNWEDKLGLSLQTQPEPDKNFKNDTYYGVNRFKFRKVDRLCRKNQEKLKKLQDEGNEDGYLKALRVHTKLMELRQTLGELIGTVGAIK